MAQENIGFKLDLVVSLFDTTTGFAIRQSEVIFTRDDVVVALRKMQDGVYIGINNGREDFTLGVAVRGFLSQSIPVRYETLDETYPTIEVQLIPEPASYGYDDLATLTGTLRGITDLAAISLHQVDATVGGYNAKKNTLRLFETRRLDEERYAILHQDRVTSDGSRLSLEGPEFEEFRIVKQSEKGLLLQLQDPLQMECRAEESVVRIVRGTVDAKGRYLLRVRKDGSGTRYLVRATVKGVPKFQIVEFGKLKERGLS